MLIRVCVCVGGGYPSLSGPLSTSLGDVDEFLDASRVGESFGVLHVFAGDLVERTANGRDRLIGQLSGATSGQPVHQVTHRVLPCYTQTCMHQ